MSTKHRDRDYAAALHARGADPVLTYGIVFDGERVAVQPAAATPPAAQPKEAGAAHAE